jgi:hypothetical protein
MAHDAKPRRKHAGRVGDVQRLVNQKRAARSRRNKPGQTIGQMTTCKDAVALIADYLSSNLSPPVVTDFESHLKACPDCTAFLKTYKKTIEVTRAFLKTQA